jgi:hypothetical protein
MLVERIQLVLVTIEQHIPDIAQDIMIAHIVIEMTHIGLFWMTKATHGE